MGLIDGLYNQVIDTVASVTHDGYGDETSTTIYSSVPCRWVEQNTQLVTGIRETKESKVSVWLSPNYTILYDYKIIKDGEPYEIVSVEKKRSFDGTIDHVRLYLV